MSSTTPPSDAGGPEYLDQSGGDPLLGGAGPRGGGGGRRTVLVAGGALAGLVIVGGGVWAAMSFLATGEQPATALPASTIGYASIDLDPSGGQKIEAFRMVQKFPAIKKELGGLNADDDLLGKAFEDLETQCDLTYEDDVQPWLGYRFAAAAVDLGEDLPTPVGVVQISDASAAEEGLTKLQNCADADVGGWVIEGDWAVIAETEDLARQVTDATAQGTLSDDETFQDWTAEVGDAGVMSLYAAPEAGAFFAELAGTFAGGGMMSGLTGELPMDPDMTSPEATPAVPEELTRALEEFQGAAATVRFADGALEFEAAGGSGSEKQLLFATDRGDDVISTLPEDTAAAIGFGFAEGWATAALEQVANATGEMTVADLETELEDATGLTIGDLETLAGESATLALSSDIDPDTFFNSTDGSDVPVGAKVQGDAAGIQDVLSTLVGRLGSEANILGNDADGDMVAIGPNPDYRKQLLEDGGLGDSDVFQNVVREAGEANAIVFVNFDAGDWLTSLAEGDQQVADNLVPLQGLGFSSWSDDNASHVVFRLTTN